ncbi:MAG: BON domain-containing protein [Bdellovibrionales bacterium]|nr:BON domain-containing protein [Bdellovibrionales bacterium]
MNRKNQGSHSSARGQGLQARPSQGGQFNQTQGYQGNSHDQENEYEGMGMSSQNDYEVNDRNRGPLRYSSLDEERSVGGYDRSAQEKPHWGADRSSSSSLSTSLSSGRPTERFNASSDRFGYPSSMNSWSGNERSSRMGTRSQRPPESYETHSYAESSLGHEHGTERSERGFFGKGPKGYRRSDDRIKEDVCETLARNPRVDASDIEVKVEDACVTLSGTVDSKEAKRAAEMAIEDLSGVDDVKNEIRVKKMGERGMDSSIHASSSGTNSHSRDAANTMTSSISKSTKNS